MEDTVQKTSQNLPEDEEVIVMYRKWQEYLDPDSLSFGKARRSITSKGYTKYCQKEGLAEQNQSAGADQNASFSQTNFQFRLKVLNFHIITILTRLTCFKKGTVYIVNYRVW